MKVLLVEDDERTARFIEKGLRQEGYVVEHAADGDTGLFLATTGSFDVAVVDLMLPVLDGLSLISRLREAKVQTPVLILSARTSVDDRVKGLQTGGDDYLVKPFAFTELLARLQALLRRGSSAPGHAARLEVADLMVDTVRRKAFRGDNELLLQPKEYALLEYLMRNAGRIVSKTMIMEHVWDYNFDPQTNVVEARICRLREKIHRPESPPLIHTVRGMGYVLEEKRT